MTERQNPADPVVDGKGRQQGGFAAAAELLNELFPPSDGQRPISRQRMHKLWTSRHANDFPEAVAVRGSSNGGRGYPEFNYQAIVDWYIRYRSTRLTGTTLRTGTLHKSLPQQNHGDGSLAA